MSYSSLFVNYEQVLARQNNNPLVFVFIFDDRGLPPKRNMATKQADLPTDILNQVIASLYCAFLR